MKYRKINRCIFTAVLLCAVSLSGFSQSADSSSLTDKSEVFELSLRVDIPVAAAGTGIFVAGLLTEPATGAQADISRLIFPDNLSIFPYNYGMDFACEVLFGASLLLPAASFIGADFNSIMETGVMFIETMLLTFGTKDLIKDLVVRYRPYTYVSSPVDDDYMNSFPSGHTAVAFAISGFASYVFCGLNPDSEWKIPVVAASYSMAAATALLRIFSGNHFPTDVAAGAVIGTIYGIGVPWLHKSSTFGESGVAVDFTITEKPSMTVAYTVR